MDLETRDVELEIGLPLGLNADQIRMCLVEDFAYKSFNQTHSSRAQGIATFRLLWETNPVRRYRLTSAA